MNAPNHLPSISSSPHLSALELELAKILRLVAPISMDGPAQLTFIASAAEALEGISPQEVQAVSVEVRRKISRHNQIVPEIVNLVDQRRKRSHRPTAPSPYFAEMRISDESRKRRPAAKTAVEIEAAWEWERNARIDAGLHVPPIAKPFSRYELDNLRPDLVRMGLNSGFLKREGARLVEVMDVAETDRIRERNRR